jgi:LacI family transcriptional regulator
LGKEEIMMVTMKEVAARAGVSLITVSRVVNKSGYVGEVTRKKVEAAIEELQFVPNMLASNLRSQQSDLFALVLPDITNSFWTTIARGAEDEAWSQGYGVFICDTNNDPDKEDAYIQRLLQRRVEGVLLVPSPMRSTEAQIERLKQHGMKFVVIHRRLDSMVANVVRSDGEGAARALTAELARTGRKRIAFVGLSSKDVTSIDRLRGFRDGMRRADLPVDEDLIRFGEGVREPHADRVVADLLALPDPPDGIFLSNSRVAIGGLRAIAEAGLSIPEDITVAAFHDISAMDSQAPRLIAAVQPAYRMGQLAARRLLEMRRGADEPYKEMILETKITRWQDQPQSLFSRNAD